MKELVVTWNNGQAENLKHTLYFQNKSISFKQNYDTCLNIRLCKNYTKVIRWCGHSVQWTQYAVDAVE